MYFSLSLLRFTDLTTLAVIGGKLDRVSPQEVSKKFGDELAVTVLNSRGMVGVSFCTLQFGSYVAF